MTIFEAGAMAFGTTALASPLVLWLIRGRIVDVPNERSSHVEPTPRGGGVALIAGVLAALSFGSVSEPEVVAGLAVALVLGVFGLVDDLRNLPVAVRFGFQVAVAAAGVAWYLVSHMDGTWPVLLGGLAAVVWLVGFTNVFNFMDGINGISAAQMIVAGGTWVIFGDRVVLPILGAVTIGAALGFLPWNFPNAKFFMGDVGSYFAGAWLAVVTLIGMRLGVHPVVMVAPLLVYGVDTTLTLARRIIAGEDWTKAHRSHAYQRLVAGGWTHARTTGFYTFAAVLTTSGASLAVLGGAGVAAVGWLLVIASLSGYLVAPVILSRR